jgi:hypothetical protein
MTETNLSFTVSVVVPVMFIVVLELCNIARDIDLKDNLPREESFIGNHFIETWVNNLITTLPGFNKGEAIPSFGYFGVIHAVNVVILVYGIIVVSYATTGLTRYILTVAVTIMLAILPIIEIEEYRIIEQQSGRANSRRIHFWVSMMSGILFGFVGVAHSQNVPLVLVVSFTVISLVFFTIGESYFSVTLRREIEKHLGVF